MAWDDPEPQDIKARLQETKTIAVIGLSNDPGRDANAVSRYLAEHGYHIVPVNPTIDAWQGQKAYPDLVTAKETMEAEGRSIDIVDVFRAPEHVPAIVDQVVDLKLPALWLQLGVVDEAAAQQARDAGVWVVMDRCIKVDHARLVGR